VAVRDGTPLLSELLRTHRVNHAAYVSINVFAACLLMNDTEVRATLRTTYYSRR